MSFSSEGIVAPHLIDACPSQDWVVSATAAFTFSPSTICSRLSFSSHRVITVDDTVGARKSEGFSLRKCMGLALRLSTPHCIAVVAVSTPSSRRISLLMLLFSG
jgi:hypothetical protein